MRHAGDMHLPGPLRAAVGLVATAAAEAKHLPDRAIELPMLAVSSALQASLRAQQRYARLAARGDEVLNRRAPTEEPPPWATFDDPVPLGEVSRTFGAQSDDPAADHAAAGRSMFDQLFAVEDPTVPADGREPVDEIPSFDEPPVRSAPPTAQAAAPKAPKKAPRKAAARKATARKSAAKSGTTSAVKAGKAVKKATKDAAGASSSGSRSTPKGPLSKPRHTTPSAFDDVADD